jgi:membrane fusion protein (multidrug efflux system)
MNARRLIYLGVAALGISSLGAYAYYAQRVPNKPAGTVAAIADPAPAPQGGKGGKGGAGNGPAAVDVARVVSAKLIDDLNSVGTLRSNEAVMVRPEVAGRISQLNFRDGQGVKKGQLLVAFEASVNRAEVRQARAEFDIARANLARNEDLARQNFISVRARDESAANVQVLEAKLALAEAKLAKLEILAPFSGVVGMRNVSVGDYVKDGADLVNLEDISSVKVDFRVPERYADLARPGQQIEVMVDALPGKPFKAKVDAIDPQVDSGGRSALLRGRIENPQGRLKPGMFARVRLILSERANALMVPEEAIVPQGARSVVWKVVDGKALRAEVKTGQRRAAQVEILEGLQAGDTVVVAGQMRLNRDGAPVRIVNGPHSDAAPDGAAIAGVPARIAKN